MKHIIFALLCISFFGCSRKTYVADADVAYTRIDDRVTATDPATEALIAPYKAQLDAAMNEEIGAFAEEMVRSKPNSNLGNWFADALLTEVNHNLDVAVDMAFQNYGGMRLKSIGAGPITIRTIYELMPFENEVVILTADSTQVQQLLDRIANYGGWPVAGVIFTIDQGLAHSVMVQGEPLRSGKNYRLAISDYIANGGDKCFFLKDLPREPMGLKLRDMLIDHLKRKEQEDWLIPANTEERIKMR